MSLIRFVDTTVRDGNQSLWATGMRTETVLSVVRLIAEAGFDAIGVLATSFEKKMVRELDECPFERIRAVKHAVGDVPLRVIRGRYLAAFQITPLVMEELWYRKMADVGISQVRSSDASHTFSSWKRQVDLGRQVGIDTIINMIFSISPRHTDAYYAQKAKEAASLNPFRICLKDPGALLTPERMRTLVPAIQSAVGEIPLEFHTHCNTGLGGVCTVEAVKMGIDIVNTAIPPLSDGSSNPSYFEVAENLRALGHQIAIDDSNLHEVTKRLTRAAKKYGMPLGALQRYNAAHYVHQVPGGMISNLRHQLNVAGLGDRLQEVLDEVARVRADFGYPIMVTPYSQFMGAQAVLNIVSGQRYKLVSDELIQYALGYWGDDERDSMDPNVRDKVLSLPRATELAGLSRHDDDETLDSIRKTYDGVDMNDEDLLLNFLTSRDDVLALRAKEKQGGGRVSTSVPLIRLIENCEKASSMRVFNFSTGSTQISITR